MHRQRSTPAQVNKVKITVTKRKMSAYGGFALIAAFFRQISVAEMVEQVLPVTEFPRTAGVSMRRSSRMPL